jgi:type VI secretion system secreted protein VgrG
MAHTQDTRLCQIRTTLAGANTLLVGRLSATEAVSRLFQVELDLLSPRRDIRPEELLGEQVVVSLELNNGQKRFFHGFVSRFAQGDVEGNLFGYSAEVVPWMWFLSRNVDCRIFQDQTVPQILDTVFKDHGFNGFFEIKAPSASTPREYCVQYRETDLHFVSRLMEEEGLFYFFKHTNDKHVLVVTDGSETLPTIAAPSTVSLRVGDPRGREIERWSAERELHSGVFGTAEFNVEDRSLISSLELTSVPISRNPNLEVFDFPSEQTTFAASDRRAQLRMQAEEASAARHSGLGKFPGFTAGHLFKLTDHFHAALNDEYMLTTVHHSVTQEIGASGSSSYFNSFSAVRASIPFRPPLVTPKPIVQGPQTAIVVGKADRGKLDLEASEDDIDVDSLGRVLVKFHWDRSGPSSTRDSKKKHESSSRVRVSQVMAGKNWGAAFWPRIGQEVIVEFIEGDPDHPIITGRVYNGKFKPPYDLVANKTQSGVKTRSTPNGTPEHFNEIRFEDKKGHEELFLHAEKTMSVKVKGSQSVSVGGGQTVSVGGDQKSTVKKNTIFEVTEGGYNIEVKQKQMFIDVPLAQFHVHAKKNWNIAEEEIALDVHGNTIRIDTNGITLTATAGLKLKCGGSTIDMSPAEIKITSPLIKLN